jgi:antitoxin ParD1/3/4
MSTMNISLPDDLKAFVDGQVDSRAYTSSSEYIRELIRNERDKAKLRALLLEGAASPVSDVVANKAYFDDLRAKAREWSGKLKAPTAQRRKSAAAIKKSTKVKRIAGR